MLTRNGLMFLAGAAIFALDASAASAQAKPPTSQKRIPITKESPGEVVAPRVDTVSVTVYKTDTLRMPGRTDTLRLTNTVTRTDTVIQSIPMTPRHIGGMYFGIAGGVAAPYGAIRTVNEPGPLGQVQVGWQGLNNFLGLRADAGVTRYAHNADYATLGDRPVMFNGNADVRMNLPVFTHTLGSSVIFTPYLIGGGSWVRYSNLRTKLSSALVNAPIDQRVRIANGTDAGSMIPDHNSYSNFGWNAGGGLAFHAGRKEMFIEARGVHFNTGDQFHASWQVPIVFGINVF